MNELVKCPRCFKGTRRETASEYYVRVFKRGDSGKVRRVLCECCDGTGETTTADIAAYTLAKMEIDV